MDSNMYGFRHRWSSRSPILIICILLYGMVLVGCSTYTHPDGSKTRALKFTTDGYRDLEDQEYSVLKEFDMANFQAYHDFSTGEGFIAEEVQYEDIWRMIHASDTSFVVLWFPSCGAILPSIQRTMKESRDCLDFPVIMVSMSYALDQLYTAQELVEFRKRTYVLDHQYGNTILEKHTDSVLELCPDCFDKYGMEYKQIYGFMITSEEEILAVYRVRWNDEKKTQELVDYEEFKQVLCGE